MTSHASALRLYLVAGPENTSGDFPGAVEAALLGGVNAVQLRSRQLSDKELLRTAIQIRNLCTRYSALFLVNDRIDIALASGADGVHLGVDDLPLEAARSLSGPDFLIGYSPESEDQLASAASRGATYLGIGPVFGTSTKHDAGASIGTRELGRRIAIGRLPVVGIGGITADNAQSVIDAGAQGIAVVSAIMGAPDPELAARQLSRNSKSSSTRGSSAGSQ